ncbi:MAG: hypothetical protein JG781_210 [Peptococcaceae bacterium]|jgi:putative membrane protein (TIGR04086 family)|nr:hypothetical protein [Peptococcaceae bacterium]
MRRDLRFWRKIKQVPGSLQRFYEGPEYGLELKAVWLGFTTALGVWFCAVCLGLLWIMLKGAGSYWFGAYVYLVGLLGVFLGGLFAGSRVSKKGWLHGLWVGVLLGMLGIIVNLELAPQLLSLASMGRQLLVWSLWGLTGGYIGSLLLYGPQKKSLSRKEKRPGTW